MVPLENITKTTASIKSALKQLDKCSEKILIIVDKDIKLLGTLTDGDIRRALLKNTPLTHSIDEFYNKNPISLEESKFSIETAQKICIEHEILGLPIVDKNNIIADLFYYQTPTTKIQTNSSSSRLLLDIPVVIMGGGKGTRMKPISDVFPKPLIPLSGKPMVNHIIDYFNTYGINTYYLTLNYKSELMIAYFESLKKNYTIDFVIEPFFMGTAGSIKLLESKLPKEFIISNCDCIAKTDFSKILKQHKEKKSILTVVCSIQHHQIPYGKINYTDGGLITSIEEKPELSIPINTGIYIVNKKVLDLIETDKLFHMTHLIEKLIVKKLPVHCFFINEKEFIDFGQWKEYEKALNLIR
jgi:dTDP-glucose pyrophosphorylase